MSFLGKKGVVSKRKEKGTEIFSCVFLDKSEETNFIERLKEAGKFVKVI